MTVDQLSLVCEKSAFDMAQMQLDRAAAELGLDPGAHAILREPMRELHVSLPVVMDDGCIKVFKGFRVQHNDARGPAKGGIRFHPDETIDTIRALACWMTWKCSLADIPLGGGKGGVVCNPKVLSQGELERLSRAYIAAIHQMLGADIDIPAPDVYTNSQVMAWMMDEYCKLTGRHCPGVITGKPIALGGSRGRDDATARGSIYAIRETCKQLKVSTTPTVAIQGFGNAGCHAALLAEGLLGCRVVGLSDSQGGVMNMKGIDACAAAKHKAATGRVEGLPDTEPISNEDLLELKVDILIPAAMEKVITEANADRIRARIIGEAANGPTTPEADAILYQKGIFVIPDLLCNAGGVIVSYFEMVQNRQCYYWAEEDVHQRLDCKMTKSFYDVLSVSQERGIDMRAAAHYVAVQRVAEVMRLRGWTR